MALVDVRRLAAIDLHGIAGSRLRRRLILAEFIAGGAGGLGLGLWMAVSGSAAARLLGAWMAGIGINYSALALQAASLIRPGALDAELAGAEVGSEFWRYSYPQAWRAMLCPW